MWSILVTLVVGALAGFIAEKIMNAKHSLWMNILLGVVGAYVGGFLGQLLGIYTSFLRLSVGSVLSAVVGACIVVWVVRLIRKR